MNKEHKIDSDKDDNLSLSKYGPINYYPDYQKLTFIENVM